MSDNSVYISGSASGSLKDAFEGLPPWATEKTLKDISGLLRQQLNLTKTLTTKLGKSGGGGLNPKDIDELAEIFKKYKKTVEDANKQTKAWFEDKWLKLNNKILAAMQENFKTYTQLQQAGINVVGGMTTAATGFDALQQITATTGVRFTELAETIMKYNTAVNAFSVSKFAETVKESSKGLQQFGFSSKESAQLLGSFLEAQTGFTDAAAQSQADATQRLQKFGAGLTKVSMVTGMARNTILANMEAVSKSSEASILSAQVGTEAATATLTFISAMKDQNLGRAFLKMMSDQIKPLNATFQSFQKIGLGGFGQKLMTFTQSLKGMSPEAAAQAVKAFEEQNHAAIEAGKQQANLYSQIPELAGEAQQALTMFNQIQQQARTTRKMSEEDIKKMEKTNAARARLSSAWEELQSKFQMAFGLPISLLDALSVSLEVFNKVIDTVTNTLGTGVTSWLGVISVVSLSFLGLTRTLPAVVKMFKSLLFGGGRAASAAGGAAGAAGGTVGKGAGGLISGTLEGLATGLKSLGNPKVLLGTVSLAAVASSLWIAGKAVQQFVGLDWETMAKAGVVLVGLGAAGAAAGFVAPEILLGAVAFTALGASIWVIGKALSAVGEGLNAIGGIFGNVSDGISKLSVALDSFRNLDRLKEIIATINSIDLLKAAAFAALNVVTQSAPNTRSNPSVSPKTSSIDSVSGGKAKDTKTSSQDSMPTSVEPSTPGIEKSPSKSDINSMMAQQNSFLEQMLLALNKTVSINSDILKYTRAQA